MSEKGPLVLLAHGSSALLEVAAELLERAGCRARSARDAAAALAALDGSPPPMLLVVDVALPATSGYALVVGARERGLKTPILWLPAIYDRTRYKRRPPLAAGDDHLEQHHIFDQLVAKVGRLAADAPPLRQGPPDPDVGERVRRAAHERLALRADTDEGRAAETLRLARLVAADLLLYAPSEPPRADLDEARALLELYLPEDLRRGPDALGAALAELGPLRRAAGIS